MWYHVLKWFLIAPVVWLLYRVVVKGRKNLPKSGGFIVAANHLAKSDSVLIARKLGRKIAFGAKKEYFAGVGAVGRLVKMLFKAAGQIPVDRTGRGVLTFINDATEALNKNEVIGIHVEGTRSPDGRLYKARLGIVKIALKTRVPIVPTAVLGTNVASQPGRRKRVKIIFGKPIRYDEYKSLSHAEISDLVTQRIQELSGQELANEVAPIQIRKDLY